MDPNMELPQPAVAVPVSNKRKKRSGKRKNRRAADAPRFPLTGYVRFMNQRRESLKSEHPDVNHLEITKMLADEWTKLAEELKKPYMEAADKDKERYVAEMKEYHVAHPEAQQKRKRKRKDGSYPQAQSTPKVVEEKPSTSQIVAPKEPVAAENGPIPERPALKPGQIPIFTDEFLEHNKQVETQLKALRKATTDFEFQNSNLERYIENMKTGIGNMEADNAALKNKNQTMEKYLEKLKSILANSFGNIALPVEKTATLGNIENYITELAGMHGPASTVNKAKDILRKLDLQSIKTSE